MCYGMLSMCCMLILGVVDTREGLVYYEGHDCPYGTPSCRQHDVIKTGRIEKMGGHICSCTIF